MPSLVQVASNAASATSVTVTLGSPTTSGNCLVALIGTSANTTNGTVSGITLGGSADNWAAKASEGNGADHAISAGWADPNCAGGQTTVVITLTGGNGDNLFAWVFEWSGLTGTVDVSSGQSTVGGFISSWTSGTTAATSQASEVAFGITCGAASSSPGGAAGLTGPSSPWTNQAQQVLSGSSHEKDALCGYQILSSTGTVTYSGTSSPTNTNDTLVFTLEASAGGTNANAGDATGTGAADAATLAVGDNAGDATGTGAALGASAGPGVSAGDATGTGSSLSASVNVLVPAGLAGGTGAALAGVPGISVPGGVAGGDGAALGATVTSSGTAASAGLAAGSGAALGATAGLPAVVQQGSWWGLVSVLRHSESEFDAYRSMVPMACPNDGEPLINAPATMAASGVERFCKYDGWAYPRDYVAPNRAGAR